MSDVLIHGLIAGRAARGGKGFRLPRLDEVIRPGEVIAVIGPNGAGKTTLLKTLAGLLPPLEGSIIRPRAAWLPPPGVVDAGFSALHLTALGRSHLRKWSSGLAAPDLNAAHAALDRLDAWHLADRPFDRLSSGQQQLVLIARLIVQDARLCLLDEPLALLDTAHAKAVEAAIRTLAGEGRTVIASTHHLPFAARADRVLALGLDRAGMGPPVEALAADRIRALFGIDLDGCPCCGGPLS